MKTVKARARKLSVATEVTRTPLQPLMISDQQQQLLLQEEHIKRTGSGKVLTLQELMANRYLSMSSIASYSLVPRPYFQFVGPGS
jgi:hypothetical protein